MTPNQELAAIIAQSLATWPAAARPLNLTAVQAGPNLIAFQHFDGSNHLTIPLHHAVNSARMAALDHIASLGQPAPTHTDLKSLTRYFGGE